MAGTQDMDGRVAFVLGVNGATVLQGTTPRAAMRRAIKGCMP